MHNQAYAPKYDANGHRIAAPSGDDSVLRRPGKSGRSLRALYHGRFGNVGRDTDEGKQVLYGRLRGKTRGGQFPAEPTEEKNK